MRRRLDAVEQTLEKRFGTALSVLHDAGAGKDRLREVTDTNGAVQWSELTDEELRAIAPDEGERICGVLWSELTDEELRRIEDGDDPERVIHSL
jgi:hypothetical protein